MKRSMLVDRLDTLNFRKLIVKDSRIGMALRNQCDFCRGMIEEERFALGYFCGHTFHRLCNDNDNMCLTCSYESDDALCKMLLIQFIGRYSKKMKIRDKGKNQNRTEKLKSAKRYLWKRKIKQPYRWEKKKWKFSIFKLLKRMKNYGV